MNFNELAVCLDRLEAMPDPAGEVLNPHYPAGGATSRRSRIPR